MAVAFCMLLGVARLCASTLTVTNAGDSGAGTLRQAILDSHAGDTINFSLPMGTTAITLTSDELLINKDLTIAGPGANLLTVQRGKASGQPLFDFRIFEIGTGSAINVAISGLTITNGRLPNGTGAGILAHTNAIVALSGCSVSGNVIYDPNDPNRTGKSPVDTPDTLCAGGQASGIHNAAVMSITNCTISGNLAAATAQCSYSGGGIYNFGTLTITGSTVSGNLVYGGGAYGGGILNDEYHTLTLFSCTISNNESNGFGGGIFNVSSLGTVNAKNTIIATNYAPASPDFYGPLTSQRYNLIGNTSGMTISGDITGNQTNVNPLLGPLQDNGGPTQTQALMPGSPAIDKGTSSGFTTDQRGFPRPIDNSSISNAVGGDAGDIGAYEDQTVCAAIVTNNNDSGPGSLRYYIANLCPDGGISFSPGVVSPISLTSGALVIDNPMTISGPGANLMTVQRDSSASTNFNIFALAASGTTNISGLTITKGNPNYSGGGVSMLSSGSSGNTLNITDCVVTGNAANTSGALPSNGGGIAIGSLATPALVIRRSTISGNSATQDGGGIFVGGTLTLINSTISGNTAARFGGGISASGTTIVRSTIANNTAATGGGVKNSFTAGNTIIAHNTATTTDPDVSGTLTSQGYNLIGNTTGTSITGTTTGNILNVNPLLGPLQNNGGPTPTLALLPGSPAIDQGSSADFISSDQRGVNRPLDFPNIANAVGGNGSDIGAFEAEFPLQITSITHLASGHITLHGMGSVNTPFTVQASADLSLNSFAPIGTATSDANGALQYDDGDAVGLTKRFYRLSYP